MPFAYVSEVGRTLTRLRAEVAAAKRREEYSGRPQWICLPPGVELPGAVVGKRRYARVPEVERWLAERAP